MAVQRHRGASGPVRKSLGGTGEPRGTARPHENLKRPSRRRDPLRTPTELVPWVSRGERRERHQPPGAASDRARRSAVTGESRERTLADGAAAKRQVGPIGIDETPVTRGLDQHCEGQQRTPRASPNSQKELGQAAITARTAGPVRAPKERRPRMTRAGGVSTFTRRRSETRGAKNRKGEFGPPHGRRGRRPRGTSNQRRSGMVRRSDPSADGTARPANAEGTRHAKPHERWPIDLSAAARRAATRPAR